MAGEPPILVTGGAGFIGSNFVRQALGAGFSVVVLDALTYAGNLESLSDVQDAPGYRFHRGDIGDADLVAGLLAQYRPRAILNFAAESHVDRSIEAPSAFIETNVVGTQRLLQCAVSYWEGVPADLREAFRFLQVSTDEIYGSIEAGEATEETAYAPNSPYAASKAAGDHLVRAFHMTYGLPTLTTCCTNNYGPYQFPEKLIPLALLKAQAGEAVPVYGDGEQRRDWIHVRDHCAAVLAILEGGRPGRAYNVSAGEERSNIEVVREICRLLEGQAPAPPGRAYESLIDFVPDRPGHDRRYALSSARLRAELGWAPKVSFSEGLNETIAWYLANGAWLDGIRRKRYGGERLGLRAAW